MNTEEIEKKLSRVAETLQRQFEEFKKQVNERISKLEENRAAPEKPLPALKKRHDGVFWGAVMVVVGIVLLGNYFRWFYLDIPIFPAILVILGAYLIFEDRRR